LYGSGLYASLKTLLVAILCGSGLYASLKRLLVAILCGSGLYASLKRPHCVAVVGQRKRTWCQVLCNMVDQLAPRPTIGMEVD
jgi:hypothetical protein